MPRPIGLPKTGGRQKGTPNKRTEILRDVLEKLDCDVPQRLVTLLPQLSPDRQADVLLELLQYVFPKRKAEEPVQPTVGLTLEQTKNFFFNITADPETKRAAELVAERISGGKTN